MLVFPHIESGKFQLFKYKWGRLPLSNGKTKRNYYYFYISCQIKVRRHFDRFSVWGGRKKGKKYVLLNKMIFFLCVIWMWLEMIRVFLLFCAESMICCCCFIWILEWVQWTWDCVNNLSLSCFFVMLYELNQLFFIWSEIVLMFRDYKLETSWWMFTTKRPDYKGLIAFLRQS